jgi:hypothetical protein
LCYSELAAHGKKKATLMPMERNIQGIVIKVEMLLINEFSAER